MFETLDYRLPPERDEAKLDALAWHILDKRPKTLLGLAIRARAERHLCRYLWTIDFERLNQELNAAFADPKMKARIAELGGTPLPGSPADFAKLFADETEKWAKVVKLSGAKAD